MPKQLRAEMERLVTMARERMAGDAPLFPGFGRWWTEEDGRQFCLSVELHEMVDNGDGTVSLRAAEDVGE